MAWVETVTEIQFKYNAMSGGRFVSSTELYDGCNVLILSALNGSGIQVSAALNAEDDENASATLQMSPGISLAALSKQREAVLSVSRIQVHGTTWLG